VSIETVNDEAPRLSRNAAPTVEFGGTVTLSADQLTATDVDNTDNQVSGQRLRVLFSVRVRVRVRVAAKESAGIEITSLSH